MRNQPLANHQWDQLLDVLSLGDVNVPAYQRLTKAFPTRHPRYWRLLMPTQLHAQQRMRDAWNRRASCR